MPLKKLLKIFVLPCLLLCSQLVFAQDRVITGRVTDANGAPMAGVNVTVKGSSVGTQTAADGTYRLTVPRNATTLVFSSVGFGTQEADINSTSVDVSLSVTGASLGEVVVIGYGTARKKDLTGSVTQITTKDFNKGPNATPEQLIIGKVPGVQIITSGGAPGAGARIRIRQGASLNASNDPLIVIDGVPVEGGGISGVANPLALINPNDIESFNILKDASATAIYGNRASNGVIIITTKKGSGGKLKVNFNTVMSLSTITDYANVLDTADFKALVRAHGTAAQIALLGNANTNWQDEIYRNAFSTDNTISFTGGIKKLPYRMSLGYLNQNGILMRDRLQRGSLAFNLNPKYLKNHLSVDFNLKASVTKSKFANQGAIGAAVFFDPTQPVYDRENSDYGGFWEWELNGLPNTLASKNPVGLLWGQDNIGNTNRSLGNLQVDYKFHFLPELRANVNFGYDVSRGYGTSTTRANSGSGFLDKGSTSRYLQKRSNGLIDFYLNYAKQLNSIRSRVDATAGYGYQDWVFRSNGYPTVTGLGVIGEESFFKTQHTLISLFARANYSFDDRYLLTATIRRDGASRFGPDNRWGVFPSAAVAWRISNESFLRGSRVLSELKLRFGWGITGQQDINAGDYPYLARYTPSDNTAYYQFGNTFYPLLRAEEYDANLKWETTETINAGFDIGFLDNRINASVDVYKKKTRDLLARISVPAGSNLANQIVTNVGNIENEGIEIAVNATPVKNATFTWGINANFTYNTREITNLSKVPPSPSFIGYEVGGISGGVGNTVQIWTVGYDPSTFYVYQQVYDQNGKPIEGVYVDRNKDGAITEADKYRYKNAEPNMYFGFGSQLEYKDWTFSFSGRGSIDNYMYNNFHSNNGTYQNFGFPNYLGNVAADVLNTGFATPRYWSDYYVENASFVKIDNISVGYNVGRVFRDSQLRINATVQNVAIFTKYSGLDPEIAGGRDSNFYPRPRVYSLGFNLDL